MDFKKYKGIIHGFPKSDEAEFIISLSFFLPSSDIGLNPSLLLKTPSTKLGDVYRDALKRCDSELSAMLNAADLKKSFITSHWGEPNEDLEFFLEDIESDLAEQNLQSFGYLILSRSALLADKLVDQRSSANNFEKSPEIKSIFAHLEKHYIEVAT